MTYQKLVNRFNLSIRFYSIPFRSDIDQGEWGEDAKHFSFVLNRFIDDQPIGKTRNIKMRGYYSQGSGIKNKPTIIDILNALSLDTQDVQSIDFEEWCSNYGYDSDSRKTYKIYKQCLHELDELINLLGDAGVRMLHKCEQL